ncbi:DUF1697 domain-containing protein [Frondihabitans cladoniiphilus]|uniref:DUF1697 domain-containing protein n=1 Tax=Frondihabitans cladoniiphilus TaxID=715785 RepID=A0ABP8VSN5_9MICO
MTGLRSSPGVERDGASSVTPSAGSGGSAVPVGSGGSSRWVALLRGINVGTAKRVPMAELRAVVEASGASLVRTVLNSGNVVFDRSTELSAADLRAAVLAATGVDAEVVVLSAERFAALADANPLRIDDREPNRLGVAFAAAPLDVEAGSAAAPPAADLLPEELVVTPEAVYQWLPNGVLASPVPPAFWKALGATVTARNDATVQKIQALL